MWIIKSLQRLKEHQYDSSRSYYLVLDFQDWDGSFDLELVEPSPDHGQNENGN